MRQHLPIPTAQALSTSFAMLRFVNFRSIGAALAVLPYGGEASAVWCFAQFVTPGMNRSKGGGKPLAARFYSTVRRFAISFSVGVCYDLLALYLNQVTPLL